jgi:hypothetical protein
MNLDTVNSSVGQVRELIALWASLFFLTGLSGLSGYLFTTFLLKVRRQTVFGRAINYPVNPVNPV